MRVLNIHGVNDVPMDPIDPPKPGADDVVVRIKACGVCGYPTELPDVVAALPRLQHKLGALISHRFPFERTLEAIGSADTPSSAKVMVEFDAAATA
jgi:hypothetical protein